MTLNQVTRGAGAALFSSPVLPPGAYSLLRQAMVRGELTRQVTSIMPK